MTAEHLSKRVNTAVRRLQSQPGYTDWLASAGSVADGDLLVLNNSFLFRQVETPKSALYLASGYNGDGRLRFPARVVTPDKKQNKPFRRVSKHAPPLPAIPLKAAVTSEMQRLGHLVFALVSTVIEDRSVDTPFRHNGFESIRQDSKSPTDVLIDGKRIVVQTTEDERGLWSSLERACTDAGVTLKPATKQAFADALDVLQGRAVASLRLPAKGHRTRSGILDNILKALREQRTQYVSSLKKFGRAKTDNNQRVHFNEVLRIAYAFAHEAVTLLSLIVSVCDLKPLVLWCTIDRHFDLSESLSDLPWTRSRHKASLKNYVDTIGNARNRAFHNVFPFDKALHFELPDGALDGAELRIFSEFGATSEGNELRFDDKQLADVMMNFRRARRRPTPVSFWSKNTAVMDAMIRLFADTNNLLKDLH